MVDAGCAVGGQPTERLRLPHTRCRLATARCEQEVPVLTASAGCTRWPATMLTTERPPGGGVDEGVGRLGSTNPLTPADSIDP
jgi:hypothetical protein